MRKRLRYCFSVRRVSASTRSTSSQHPISPLVFNLRRYQEFHAAREALLKGELPAAQEAAGHMPTAPDGFVSSFEYAGEIHLEFGGSGAGSEPLNPEQEVRRREGAVDGYIRHLHLNNGTGEIMCMSCVFHAEKSKPKRASCGAHSPPSLVIVVILPSSGSPSI